MGSGGEERGAPTAIEIRFSDPAVPGYRALGWAMQQGDWGPLPPGPHCTHTLNLVQVSVLITDNVVSAEATRQCDMKEPQLSWTFVTFIILKC